jgi:hypothetical protein
LFSEVVEIRRRIQGPEHPDTLSALNDLGQNSAFLGKFDEAAALLEQVLAARRRVLGPEHPDTAESLCVLGELLFDLDDRTVHEQVRARSRALCERFPLPY